MPGRRQELLRVRNPNYGSGDFERVSFHEVTDHGLAALAPATALIVTCTGVAFPFCRAEKTAPFTLVYGAGKSWETLATWTGHRQPPRG
jgi:hypothetical protein